MTLLENYSRREGDFPRLRYTHGQYESRPTLDGHDLQTEERMQVVFPDRTVSEHRVFLVERAGAYGGRALRDASIEIDYHGLKVWARLPEGTRMRRV